MECGGNQQEPLVLSNSVMECVKYTIAMATVITEHFMPRGVALYLVTDKCHRGSRQGVIKGSSCCTT